MSEHRHKAYALTPDYAKKRPVLPREKIEVKPGTGALENARDAVRKRISEGLPSGGLLVELEGGVYPIPETLAFDARDAGSENAPVIWRAKDGEQVLFDGGRVIDPSLWRPVSSDDRYYDRFPDASRVVCLPMSALGMEKPDLYNGYGEGYNGRDNILMLNRENDAWPELYLGDEVLTVSRWPENGWAHIAGGRSAEIGRLSFGCAEEEIAGLKDLHGMAFHGYPNYDWAFACAPVDSYDRESGRVTLAQMTGYGAKDGQRFFLSRVPETLKEPGRYLIDPDTGVIYLILPENPDHLPLRITCNERALLFLDGVSHVAFEGITFSFGRGSGAIVYGGEEVAFCGCTFSNLGYNAVRFGKQQNPELRAVDAVSGGGYRHSVRSCEIVGTGFGGVVIAAGDRETLTPCGITVENCEIHNFSRVGKCYCFGVTLASVGAVIRNNRFHDGVHSAVWFNGNDNLIEYNEFYDLVREADDAASIYSGRDYTTYGNVIRWNFFHDMMSDATTGVSVFGTYFDDNAAGMALYGNLYYRMQSAHLSHGGHDIVMENNLIVEGTPNSNRSVMFGQYWYQNTLVHGEGQPRGLHGDLYDRSPAASPLWYSKYPHLREYLTWDPDTTGRYPHYCSYRNNAIVRHKPMEINFDWAREDLGNLVENNSVLDVDPGFFDEEAFDLRLKPDSEIYKVLPDFGPIPFEKIGLYRDAWRK